MTSATNQTPHRLALYIDAFSVYHGLRAKGFKRFYWLDYARLARQLCLPGQGVVLVKYFTSIVRKPAGSRARQVTYIEALEANGGIEIVLGKYEHRPNRCSECGHRWDRPKEKMTDVNIAAALILDGLDDVYDTALLLAADAGLVPAVRAVRQRFDKDVGVVFPRGRRSDDLSNAATFNLHIRKSWLVQCQLPDPVVGPERTYFRPAEWC